MTENEAIERLKCIRLFMQINDKSSESKFLEEDYIANKLAVKALEEIQQYRAMGTVEEIKEILQIISEGQDDVDESGISTGLLHTLLEYAEYKKIGTVGEIKQMKKYSTLAKKHGTIGKVIDFCAEYEDIGTVEECREAIERQKSKIPILNESSNVMFCPVCERKIRRNYDLHCSGCGQAISWEEEEKCQ